MARFILNETSYFGAGIRVELANEIKARGFKKILLVSDGVLAKVGTLDKVRKVLDDNGIAYDMYTDIKQNPTIKNCKDGLKAFNDAKACAIVAVGGGSVIDTAKAIAITKNNPEFADVVSLEGVAATKNKCVPIIALPTTCGTAAEVTINYVITDEYKNRKMVCVDPKDIPVVAIVDSELMESMPGSLIASTGMDALTHAIEGYITKGANTISDMFHIKSIELIAKFIRDAAIKKDKAAIEGMSIGQYVAGMGFSNVGLGVVHGMAHPMGAQFDIPHGVANALLLPIVMEYNMSACKAKYADIAVAMGGDIKGLSADDAAKLAVNLVKQMSIDLKIPQTLSALNIKADALDSLSIDALNDVCTGGNPKDVTLADIKALYTKAL